MADNNKDAEITPGMEEMIKTAEVWVKLLSVVPVIAKNELESHRGEYSEDDDTAFMEASQYGMGVIGSALVERIGVAGIEVIINDVESYVEHSYRA